MDPRHVSTSISTLASAPVRLHLPAMIGAGVALLGLNDRLRDGTAAAARLRLPAVLDAGPTTLWVLRAGLHPRIATVAG